MPLAHLCSVVLDCPDPQALAEFYRAVLGGEVTSVEDKQSGLGREGAREGLREFQEAQYLSVDWPR